MSALLCWNCGENLDDVPRPISRHASCPACFNELHCCRMCRHYDATKTATCHEDRADPPLQKENANFCDFFTPRFGAYAEETTLKSDAARSNLDALFGGADASEAAAGDGQADEAEDTKGADPAPSKSDEARRKLDDLFG